MSEVTLAVYDLSKGMAKGLSAQFLGPQFQIEAIPHTGVIVYGREYYFGGGVQNDDPGKFRRNTGLMPFQTMRLGTTSVSKSQFDSWCRSNTIYTMASYDLLTRNCNNFSYDAVQYLGLPANLFPQWILEVPRTFLASPMGQMVRPMLENMQVSGPVSSSIPSETTNPWASASLPTPEIAANPWAASTNSATGNGNESKPAPSVEAVGVAYKEPKGTPALDKWTSPLISKEASAIPLCIKKLSSYLPPDAESVLIASPSKPFTPNFAASLDDAVFKALQPSSSDSDDKSMMTYALFVLRVSVLRGPALKSTDWIRHRVVSGTNQFSANHLALAWLVLSHVATVTSDNDESVLASLETALSTLLEPSTPSSIQQAVSTFVYNTVTHAFLPHVTTSFEDLDDSITFLICTVCTQPLPSDPVACERILAAMGRIVQVSPMVRKLVLDFEWTLDTTSTTSTACQQLMREISHLLARPDERI